LLDEEHAFNTIVNVGIYGVYSLDRLALHDGDHRVISRAVDVRKGFEKGFGVTAW
jgi:hypothetical protein